MTSSWRRLAFVGLALLAGAAAARAQAPNQGPMPGLPAANPACTRLEAQLGAIDRGTLDPARADQIKRYEDASNKRRLMTMSYRPRYRSRSKQSRWPGSDCSLLSSRSLWSPAHRASGPVPLSQHRHCLLSLMWPLLSPRCSQYYLKLQFPES